MVLQAPGTTCLAPISEFTNTLLFFSLNVLICGTSLTGVNGFSVVLEGCLLTEEG